MVRIHMTHFPQKGIRPHPPRVTIMTKHDMPIFGHTQPKYISDALAIGCS